MHEFWDLGRHPANSPALIVPRAATVTYGELAQQARHWQLLVAAACPRVSRPLVALEFSTSVDCIAAYLAALQAGFPVLVLEPGQFASAPAFGQIYRPDVILTEGANGLQLVSGPASADALPHPDLRLLLSTSGSTGDPKLVRLSGGNLDSNAAAIAEYLALTPQDRAITTLPLFYSYGLSVLNSYLSAGASLVLTGLSVIEPAFWEIFRTKEATSLALVPHQFDLLESIGFSGMELPGLRYITQAGGRLAAATATRFTESSRRSGWKLFIMYGQTEAAPRISYVPPETLPDSADTIGCPIPGGSLRIVGPSGAGITEIGTPGELVYSGPNVMMGYAESRADLALGAGPGELMTGDIAERTAQGFFRLVGRSKRFVKLFGLRINLDQVEANLAGRGLPAQAVAVGDRLVLLLQDSGQIDAARDVLAADYGIPPAEIVATGLETVPRLASGKVDHARLRQLAAEALAEIGSAEVADESLETAMMQATRARSVSQQDSFTALGGNSLSYLRMQIALERRLGRAPTGWEDMSLAELNRLPPAKAAQHPGIEINVDMLLRVFAIALVVAQHASNYRLYGGTWILLLVMGYSAARFQSRLITSGKGLRLAYQMLYPILPLYLAFVLVYVVLRRPAPLDYFLLTANFYVVQRSSLLVPFWFVSLYTQIVALCAISAYIGPFRRALARNPFRTSSIVLLVLLVINWLALSVGIMEGRFSTFPVLYVASHGLMQCLLVFVLGWTIRVMSGPLQMVATLVMAAGVVLVFDGYGAPYEATPFLIAAIVLLFIDKPITLPRGIARVIQELAAITLFAYLFQGVAVHLAREALPHGVVRVAVAIILAFGFAFIAYRAYHVFEKRVLAAIR